MKNNREKPSNCMRSPHIIRRATQLSIFNTNNNILEIYVRSITYRARFQPRTCLSKPAVKRWTDLLDGESSNQHVEHTIRR